MPRCHCAKGEAQASGSVFKAPRTTSSALTPTNCQAVLVIHSVRPPGFALDLNNQGCPNSVQYKYSTSPTSAHHPTCPLSSQGVHDNCSRCRTQVPSWSFMWHAVCSEAAAPLNFAKRPHHDSTQASNRGYAPEPQGTIHRPHLAVVLTSAVDQKIRRRRCLRTGVSSLHFLLESFTLG